MVVYGRKLILFGGYGVPSHPSQQDFVKNSRSTKGRGWTNELHSFDLEEGECDVLPLTVCSVLWIMSAKECMDGVLVCLLPLRDMVLFSC